ncbi:MAG: hypothetical protein HY344_02310 [Candidatus Levybacteria bacterium]|nr:hypothetical protein [Candidatus Levybacteria bacterium]
MIAMHKDFYASGFLYHPKTQQILLQQITSTSDSPSWTLLGKNSTKGRSGQEVLKELLQEVLNLKIKIDKIKEVYSYFSKKFNQDHNIYYVEVKRLYRKSPLENTTVSWFTFKQIQKLNVSEQTKQDIIIGQRVIDSSIRKSLGQRTIG